MALSNNVGFVDVFHEFLFFVLNCSVKEPAVYQDNTSFISLVTAGGGLVRTTHMCTRMYLMFEGDGEMPENYICHSC